MLHSLLKKMIAKKMSVKKPVEQFNGYHPFAVGNYFINLADKHNKILPAGAIHALAIVCHNVCIGRYGRPLLREPIRVGDTGPYANTLSHGLYNVAEEGPYSVLGSYHVRSFLREQDERRDLVHASKMRLDNSFRGPVVPYDCFDRESMEIMDLFFEDYAAANPTVSALKEFLSRDYSDYRIAKVSGMQIISPELIADWYNRQLGRGRSLMIEHEPEIVRIERNYHNMEVDSKDIESLNKWLKGARRYPKM